MKGIEKWLRWQVPWLHWQTVSENAAKSYFQLGREHPFALCNSWVDHKKVKIANVYGTLPLTHSNGLIYRYKNHYFFLFPEAWLSCWGNFLGSQTYKARSSRWLHSNLQSWNNNLVHTISMTSSHSPLHPCCSQLRSIWAGTKVRVWNSDPALDFYAKWQVFFLFVCWVFVFWVVSCLFRVLPAAYGDSQPRCRIGAAAAGLRLSHSHPRSKLCLQPTLQLMATLDPGEARNWTHILMDTSLVLNLLSHRGDSCILFLNSFSVLIEFCLGENVQRTNILQQVGGRAVFSKEAPTRLECFCGVCS